MKNCTISSLEKFKVSTQYKLVEDYIYKDLKDTDGFSVYRIGITLDIVHEKYTLQEIEAFVEPHFLYVEKEVSDAGNTIQKYILGGELEDLQNFKSIIQNTSAAI
ncbi:hypothetical protein [Kordia sp.]|uniref:hypothetical protein n=1 Tax=Kordia sp. TaxID=1965332 RepID=UPI003D6AA6CD